MFNIGKCRVCNQGLLEIVKDVEKNKIYICCDECEAEWDDPRDALVNENGTRGKFGKIVYPNQDEINKMNWDVMINEHFN